MPELDAMNPEMDPQQTAGTPAGGTDREGAMAKADLYKLANYSHKLFQQMHDDDQLEAWVQAKITKAADYIASVYHYLEYEMKFSEYGHHLDNSDTLSEGQKMKLKEVLAEAKMKMADLKKSQAEKIKEEKSSTGGEITRSKGVTKHKENPNRYSDEEHGEVASNVKSQSAAQKREKAPEQKFSPKKDKTWGMKGSEKFDHRDKELEENMEPCEHCGGAGHVPKAPVKVHPDHAGKVAKYNRQAKAFHAASKRIDANNNGIPDEDEGLAESTKEKCNHTAKGKSCPVHGLKECSGMYEAAKWRDAKHKDKLYTQEPRDYDQYDYGDDDYYNPKPDDYPGEKNLKGGGEYDHNDPLRKGYGRHGTGSMNTHGKRKGMPSRDQISSLKGSIKSAHGTHPRPNLPEAAKQTMSRAAKGHEKYGKEGMAALAKAGKEGKSLEPVKAKYNKYDEGTMPMKKVGGKSVPAFAADGKGKNDLSKKKAVKEGGDKIAAQAMWNKIKETTAYVAEKAEVEKKAKRDYDEDGTIETGKAEHAGSVDKAIKASKAKETVKESVDMTRLRELTKHLLG